MNAPMPPPVPNNASPGSAPLPQTPYPATPVKPMSSAAIVSLVAAFLSWIVLPLIGAVVAIVAGHIARGDIRRSNGTLDGDVLAIIGLVLGYLQIVLTLCVIFAFVLFFGGIAALIGMAH
jgi:Domain of unknown function (DUF4190)